VCIHVYEKSGSRPLRPVRFRQDGYRDPGATPARKRLTKQELAVTIRVTTAPGETSKARNTDDTDSSEDEA
jgi:hypothetical protein